LTWESYNLITLPLCIFDNDAIYLFAFAIPVPLAFFLFGDWNKNSLHIACAFLLGFACFELMTNALRQSISLFFLLGVFAFIGRPRFQVLFGIPALFLHDSTLLFVPLLFLVSYFKLNDFRVGKGFVYVLVLTILLCAAIFSLSSVYLDSDAGVSELIDIFQTKYEDEQSIWFQLYVALPVIWIFVSQLLDGVESTSVEERVSVGYFVVVFIVTALLFPYIPYRFAISGIAIQLFFAMRNKNTSTRSAKLIFFGLFGHMLVYLFFSRNPSEVLFNL
jgi:hypothetical protein